MPITDWHSGECRTAQIFVAVLGASNYTYAEVTWTQGLAALFHVLEHGASGTPRRPPKFPHLWPPENPPSLMS